MISSVSPTAFNPDSMTPGLAGQGLLPVASLLALPLSYSFDATLGSRHECHAWPATSQDSMARAARPLTNTSAVMVAAATTPGLSTELANGTMISRARKSIPRR